ncbi:zinc finger protein SHOOT GRAVITROPISM 5-like [Neltuma alba]|uniref:zinc finger protein SHOOT GRAVITROPISM 5 n=1 Tax=Neltuma alba TaxID=207710 RepID=UPI0010A440E6|nr:zinc finger protein SHOOT GRAVITROPISM 5-like [Prosopis alba]XP_028805512.1 zinc finger protein SHOOT GRAVITROPISM 5-like [Prosopis alba]XP_028805530.1 zinc finger protein SHOOT GRAVITROPISM 5-like [Prosopis alba]
MSSLPTSEQFSTAENGANTTNKRKRRPAGTPDPDAEVVSLSPKTLLESDRYVCEICNQGFQRDQNLQMHRRRHKVPWKLLKRETPVVRKRVFVCPEPTCLHHDPCHALGDLVGIKKHFRRKHSNHKQWVCHRCSKAYAVQSDYKAHLKTCGTRGHSCDCGRVFSRVESFIEHQDACNMGRLQSEGQPQQPACLSRTASSPSPSSETNFSAGPAWPPPGLVMTKPNAEPTFLQNNNPIIAHQTSSKTNHQNNKLYPNLDLQLSTATPPNDVARDDTHSTQLQLSIGSSDLSDKNESNRTNSSPKESSNSSDKPPGAVAALMVEKAYAEEARKEAKRQMEAAEQEFANARRIRQQAQAELDKAFALKEQAIKQINSTMLQITCQACKQQFHQQAQKLITEGGQVLDHNNNNGKENHH